MNAPLAACWRAEDARSIFVTEALEGDDAVFLATHTPIEGFDLSGRDAAEFDGNNEQAVLETLTDPSREHAFCVVQGEPGSGKSHLIRWLSVNWPHKNDIKVLLRRADGSLEGALRQLRERLPPEFSDLFDKLGQRQNTTAIGRARIFLSTLANTLEPGHFDRPLQDEVWCKRYAPAELLNHQSLRSDWQAPSRILALIQGTGGGRNSATASFDLFDIQELGELCSKQLTRQTISGPCRQLAILLSNEAEKIRAFRDENWLAEEVTKEHKAQFQISLALADALNLRRNDAIQNVLGISAQGLKALFRQVREALASRKQRLVLLLEDITSWEGIDDSLIDMLVFNASARGEADEKPVCPLISVVGVTPKYRADLPKNYEQRITHEITLGSSTDGLQDVATLREAENRERFVARYLSAVRAGPEQLQAWLKQYRDQNELPPPNKCVDCPRREACFDLFGSKDGVGFFPFTPNALGRFYEALKENDNGQTWKTPRGILQAILNPNLLRPESLKTATYPGNFIEPDAFRSDRRSDRVLASQLMQIVDSRIESIEDRARMKRMLAYWANPNSARTTATDGELEFAGTRRGVFEAFGLPWIGAEKADLTTSTTARPVTTAIPAPETPTAPPYQPPTRSIPVADPPRQEPRPAPTRTPPRLTSARRTEPDVLLEQIRGWTASEPLLSGPKLNEILFELINAIDSRSLGYPPPLVKKIVTGDMVKLEGTTTRSLDYFILPAEPWARIGLEAFVALKYGNALESGTEEFHRRCLAAMMRRLRLMLISYLDRRVPPLEDGSRWSQIAIVAQVLLARAYLRGSIRPEADITDQMRAILSDETIDQADQAARCTPWRDWLASTRSYQDHFRTELRSMISLGTTGSDSLTGGSALIDSSELVGAVLRLVRTGKCDPVPAADGGLPDLHKSAKNLAQKWNDDRISIYNTEAQILKNRAGEVSAQLRGSTVIAHLERLYDCITGIAKLLPTASADKVQAWLKKHQDLKVRLGQDAGKSTEALIIELEENEYPKGPITQLAWFAQKPAGDLAEILDTLKIGERTVEELRNHARDCVREAGAGGSMTELKAKGVKFQELAALFDTGDRT